MPEWLTKLWTSATNAVGDFFSGNSKPKVQNNTRETVKFFDKKPTDFTKLHHEDNGKRVANSVSQLQNLEDLAGKHFGRGKLNFDDGSVTKALEGYAKDRYGKSLNELNEEQYRSACNAANSYINGLVQGAGSPRAQLDEHYLIISQKFIKKK